MALNQNKVSTGGAVRSADGGGLLGGKNDASRPREMDGEPLEDRTDIRKQWTFKHLEGTVTSEDFCGIDMSLACESHIHGKLNLPQGPQKET